MKLNYKKNIENSNLIVHIDTQFNDDEIMLLKQFGEPIIKFHKIYFDKFEILFETMINTGFARDLKFNGNFEIGGIEAANEAFELFKNDIINELKDKMYAIKEKYHSINNESDSISIEY